MIPFNKPFMTGKETEYITEAIRSGKISGDGMYTKKCHEFFERRFGFPKVLLTTSCTDALEMAAILLEIGPGDEVIVPSFTFVSTANAFVLRGAKIVFVDTTAEVPNIDPAQIEPLVTPKTKAIVVVHYAGIACDMDAIMDIARRHNLFVVEDAAQAIDSQYKGRYLGTFGHLAAFSFHETKNIFSGEGGMLVINDERFIRRAEIIREKGTNRSAFFRGEVDKYGWVDIGSSFLPSDIIAAFLFAQLECLPEIQRQRTTLWEAYYRALKPLENQGLLLLPRLPGYATNNGHMFFLVCRSGCERDALLGFLKSRQVYAVFHYLSLHRSTFFEHSHEGGVLPHSDRFSETLLRLPLFFELGLEEVRYICATIFEFFGLTAD
ncbi:MAG: dTDP-4-amino-4,6-dideoxygalactose transaminase [Acidobacteriota bacterium]